MVYATNRSWRKEGEMSSIQVGIRNRLQAHLIPWPAVRTAALQAWQRVRARHLLTGTSWEVLELITRVMWVQAVRSPSHALYCTPGERWMGERLSMGREAMSDAVCSLEAHGLLYVTRRRPLHGEFQTNLYKLSGWLAATLIGSLRRARGSRAAVVALQARSALGETRMSHAEDRTALARLVERWLKRGEMAAPCIDG